MRFSASWRDGPLCHVLSLPLLSAAMPVAGPVFGFLAFTSGSYEGAIIRDIRLANELHRRGFAVRIYWLMEQNSDLVDEKVPQSMLARALRFQFRRPRGLLDSVGRNVQLVPGAR